MANQYDSYADFYEKSAYGDFPQKTSKGGSFGLTMIEVEQGAVEMTDPAFPELVITGIQKPILGAETNYGDGWKRADMVAGIVDIQPANTECSYRLPPSNLQFLAVPLERYSQHLDLMGIPISTLDAVSGTFREQPEARRLIDLIFAAGTGESGPANDLLIDGAFLQLTGHLLHACNNRFLEKPVPSVGNKRIASVINYIESNIQEPITVEELAAIIDVSIFQFSRCFKAEVGLSPHAYVLVRRIERAKTLLATTDLPPAHVAFDCGFASQSHMSDVFRTKVGASPLKYRAEVAA